MIVFTVLNTKEDILKNVEKQNVDVRLSMCFHTMKVNGYHQLFGYQHSSEYLILCSTAKRNSYRYETT